MSELHAETCTEAGMDALGLFYHDIPDSGGADDGTGRAGVTGAAGMGAGTGADDQADARASPGDARTGR